ncbi:hypothetical protein K9L27_04210 [Candidatus Gracilibacteria bacterium]|nr:hypothetical protein [Candidatus Gracilibacteria bacterium]
MENAYKQNFTIPSIFFRFLVGFGSGFIGTVVLGLMLFLSWKIVGETLSPSDVIKNEFGITITDNQTHPLFLSIVTLAVFLATMTANISHVFLSSIIEEKYTRRSTTLTQVFFGNLVFLLLLLPLYLLASHNFGPTGIAVIAVLHATLTTLFCFLVTETLHQSKYFIVNLYGTLFGVILFSFLANIILKNNTTTLTLMTLPFLLGCIALGSRFAEVLYAWMFKTYGTDFLNVDTQFGKDYGKSDEEEKNADFEV